MTIKPECPWCRKKAVVFYTRTDGAFQPSGYYCPNCGKPVDAIVRKPPVVYRMQVEDFLQQHKKGYDVIMTDPPWRYNEKTVPMNRRPEEYYNTMKTEDITSLPIQNITNKRAICFMWTPSSKINEALQVMNEWGFEYKTKMTWVKTSRNGNVRIGLGNDVRNTSEDLLIGKKGDFPVPKMKFPSTFHALQTDNSRKPKRGYEIIENMYPDASRIEIFARYVHPGWVGVGNQAEPLPENVYIPKGKMYTNSEKERIQNFEVEVI